MLKRIKSVSMLLALAGVSSTGAAYAVAVPRLMQPEVCNNSQLVQVL